MKTKPSNDHVLVGLTGSIGSGKSTVADIFEEDGIPVLRADLIARELMTKDPDLVAEIRDKFGDAAYCADGSLNRPFIADTIFNSQDKLATMNRLVHPRTIAEQGRRAAQLFDQGYRVVACEAALIFESGGEGHFDYIVVVDAERSIRISRAAERDGATLSDIERREQAQTPASKKVEMADFVIRNDTTPEELRRSTKFIAMLLSRLPPRQQIETDETDGDSIDDSSLGITE